MTTHNVSISIKVLATGISIDINTESPQTTIPIKTEKTLNLDDYEGLKKLLPLYDDNIITHTECAVITADEDEEETNTIGEFVDEDNDEEETDDDEETIAEYITAALEDPNPDVFLTAVRDVARARGMAQLAKDAGLGRESLYKALTPGAKPRYDTMLKLLHALGVKLSASSIHS